METDNSEEDETSNLEETENATIRTNSDLDESDGEEDEVVKAIKAEKSKPRDHPPTINCEDFIVDISFSPSKNLIALANIMGDVLLYEYKNDENKLLNTLELHVKACRDVEFNEEGDIIYTAGKVSFNQIFLYKYVCLVLI